MSASKPQKRQLKITLIAILSLTILLLIWPTESGGAENASADSVMVSKQLLIDARDTIDELEFEVAMKDSTLAAQRDYYVELLELKDQRISILEEAVEDALGSPTKDFLDKLLWGLAGYGMGRAAE